MLSPVLASLPPTPPFLHLHRPAFLPCTHPPPTSCTARIIAFLIHIIHPFFHPSCSHLSVSSIRSIDVFPRCVRFVRSPPAFHSFVVFNRWWGGWMKVRQCAVQKKKKKGKACTAQPYQASIFIYFVIFCCVGCFSVSWVWCRNWRFTPMQCFPLKNLSSFCEWILFQTCFLFDCCTFSCCQRFLCPCCDCTMWLNN